MLAPASAAPTGTQPSGDGRSAAASSEGSGAHVAGPAGGDPRFSTGLRGGSGAGSADAGRAAGAGGGGALALATPGDGGGVPAEYGPYLARVRRRVQEALVYPLAARRRGLAGSVEVEVLIDASGAVASSRIVASSSHELLDDAALEAIRSLDPLPLPASLPRRPLRVRLPLSFRIE